MQVWNLIIHSGLLGCITSANFTVLVNGILTNFFKIYRGLRQGCPLSPLLFLLVIEGLSKLIEQANTGGKLTGIKVSSRHYVTFYL